MIALHHLDIGWKPSDLEQREGRIIRQGNHNKKVHIFRYVTESTFEHHSSYFHTTSKVAVLNNHLKWNGEDRYDREISIVKES